MEQSETELRESADACRIGLVCRIVYCRSNTRYRTCPPGASKRHVQHEAGPNDSATHTSLFTMRALSSHRKRLIGLVFGLRGRVLATAAPGIRGKVPVLHHERVPRSK